MYGLAMGIKRTFNGGLQKGGCRVIIKGQIIRATHAEKADDTCEGKQARLPRVPPRVEYALSPLGETPGPILDAMATWGTSTKTSDGGGTW